MQKSFIYIFLLHVLLIHTTIKAQSFTDSLQHKNYQELLKIHTKNKQADSTKAKKALTYYIKKAKINRDTIEIINGYLYKSYVSNDNSKLQYYDSIIALTKENPIINYPSYIYFAKAGHYLYQKRDIQKTLYNLTKARKYTLTNDNTDLLYRVDYLIGIVKSEHLNEKEKAISIFKKCIDFYGKEIKYEHKSYYLSTLHALAETYIALEKNDSSTFYNNLGYNKSSNSNDVNHNQMKTYFTLCEGINQYAQKNYYATIDSISKALPKMIEFEDKSNTIDSYFYLGRSYFDINDKEKAVSYFKKTDSILETLNSIPQYKHVKTYEYLKDYYKDKNDIQNQNKYLNKLNSVLSNYLDDQIFISKKVKEDYDIPLLLEEQEIVIKKLNKNTNTYKSSILILGVSILILGSLLYYQYRKKQVYRSRFEKLMKEQKTKSKPDSTKTNKQLDTEKILKVPEKHVTYILNKLDKFEKEHRYLTLGLSSQSLADEIETNVKYLSRVINHYKNKTFTNYLNELRINYALKELKENIMLRKFTIKAIANEFGYNSAETFSNAFYKQVQIKPSYYIKQLGKVAENT